MSRMHDRSISAKIKPDIGGTYAAVFTNATQALHDVA